MHIILVINTRRTELMIHANWSGQENRLYVIQNITRKRGDDIREVNSGGDIFELIRDDDTCEMK
jgi:hypothetical protein